MKFKSFFVSWLLVGVLAILLAWGGVSNSKVGGIYAVGSVGLFAFFWLNNFLVSFRQQAINRKMLSLLKQLGSRGEIVRPAEKRKSSWLAVFLQILLPWIALSRSIAMARNLTSDLGVEAVLRSVANDLSPKEKESLSELQMRQMKLLGRRSISRGDCRQPYYHDSMFAVLVYRQKLNPAREERLIWCKDCLVSWWTIEQIPVIVHPPK